MNRFTIIALACMVFDLMLFWGAAMVAISGGAF